MSRLPIHIISALLEARSAANMEKASFGFPNDTVTVNQHAQAEQTLHPTDYIKKRTKLYRQSWIISRIDEVLEWAGVEPPKPT